MEEFKEESCTTARENLTKTKIKEDERLESESTSRMGDSLLQKPTRSIYISKDHSTTSSTVVSGATVRLNHKYFF